MKWILPTLIRRFSYHNGLLIVDDVNRPGFSGGRVLPVPVGSGCCSHGSTGSPSRGGEVSDR